MDLVTKTHRSMKPVMRVLMLRPPVTGQIKNVVRDFIYGCWCNGKRIGGMHMPPLSELYCATHTRQQGVEISFLDADVSVEKWNRICSEGFASIDLVAIMCSTQSFEDDTKLFKEMKHRNPSLVTVLYGSHPTFMPEYCLRSKYVDFIVTGEPEETLRELIRTIKRCDDASSSLGIGYRSDCGEPVINNRRPFLDLDKLPIPDRSLLPKNADYFNPVVKRLPYATIQTSRGCPGRCIFCTVPFFYGKKYRYRSAENVLKEIELLQRKGYRELFFRDETFTANRIRNREICCGMIECGLNLSWIANGRVDMVDLDSLKLMKKAGCHMIKFGVETASQELLNNYKKGIRVEQVEKAFSMARQAGLDTHSHFVIGGPGESWDTINKTIEFAKKIKTTTASFGILTPFPGTPLFDMVSKKHPEIRDGSESNMKSLHVEGFFSEAICGMSGDELSKAVKKAYRKFYLRPSYLISRLLSIKSLSEFAILSLAGLNILSFSISGKK